jgi:hypothetical protein
VKSNPDFLTEKQKIEKATAEIILRLLNKRLGTEYQIIERGDFPDIRCKDIKSGLYLNLEITLFEDREGDIRYKLGRGIKQIISPRTNLPITSFSDNTIPMHERAVD